jgi:GDP-L-fucose synthase
MNNFWWNKKVLVTGGAGFIGSYLVEKLVTRGAKVTVLDNLEHSKIDNLETVKNKINLMLGDCKDYATAIEACDGQDVVMNLAAKVRGIEYNRTHQSAMMVDNLSIATNIIKAASRCSVERFLVVSSACVYPRDAIIPTPEAEGFISEPEPTNSGYGWAKRMAELLGKYYNDETNMKVGIVRPYNCYGPRDHFDLETSHVIPALIKRILDKENPLKVWGSGNQTRAFVYVEDMAEGLIQAIEKYPVPDPVNLGTNEEISIRDLASKIFTIMGIDSEIVFDTSKPDGSLRRNSDNTKMQKEIGFIATTSLDEGLKKTIEWYKKQL